MFLSFFVFNSVAYYARLRVFPAVVKGMGVMANVSEEDTSPVLSQSVCVTGITADHLRLSGSAHRSAALCGSGINTNLDVLPVL